ncbi:MAG: HAD-IIA family hydrolase, partial [Nocardioidaceae bacterium]
MASSGPLVDVYDCAMFDLDGVVYVGPRVIDGVPDRLRQARKRNLTVAFVTNNASRTAEQVAQHLRDLGVEAAASDVVTSAQAAASEVAARVPSGERVLVIGGEGLEEALRERDFVPVLAGADIPEPDQSDASAPMAVVQGFAPSVSWRQLAHGAAVISSGALWVASNLDLTIPTAYGISPGNGTLVNAVAAAVGRRPDVVAGKPFRPLFDETVRRVSAGRPLVVGDRLDTDIE